MRAWYDRHFGWIPKPVRQVIIGVIGGTLLLLGLVGMVLPIMPGFVFIPLAFAILAVEFAWATRWLIKIKRAAKKTHNRMKVGWNFRWATPMNDTSKSQKDKKRGGKKPRRSRQSRK